MTAENVRALDHNVNPTVTEVCQWLTKKAECGDVPESSARLATTAIRELSSNLDAGEPEDDAAWVRDNLGMLGNRWSTKNTGAKADTVRTYLSRARGALEKYFAWRDNPAG